MVKGYCTQNEGDCSTCSLVNYNRDCQNNPIHGGSRPGAGRPPVEEIRKARTFKATDAEWEKIHENAKKAGMNASEYIRSKTLND